MGVGKNTTVALQLLLVLLGGDYYVGGCSGVGVQGAIAAVRYLLDTCEVDVVELDSSTAA